MVNKHVSLYLGSDYPVQIPVSQFDTGWTFIFTIYYNGTEWTIPEGSSVVMNGLKPDGNVFAFSGLVLSNKVVVEADIQMTAVAGDTICELSILCEGLTVGTANFTLAVEAAPKSPDDVSSDSTLPAYAEMLEMFSGDITNAVDAWLNSHASQIGGLSNEAKQALLTLLTHVAYTDDQGQTYLDALETALYPPANLVSISAVFNQGSAVIYDTDSLDTLKQYLTVTALYSDSTTETVTSYTLSGTLTEGTSTITVSYGGKTTTFNVTVSAPPWISGYDSVGTPTISNNVLTPSTNGYIKTPQVFAPGNASWAIQTKFVVSATNAYQNLLRSVDANNASKKAVLVQRSNSGTGKFTIIASSNDSSSDIFNSTSVTLVVGNTVYFEIGYDGNQTYSLKSSSDGNEWNTINTITSSKKVFSGDYIAFGGPNDSLAPYGGNIYLEDTKIFIDGEIWWKDVDS